VAFEREEVAAIADVRGVVEAAFAHRRKTAANALAHSGLATRDAAGKALAAIGRPPTARAEELRPEEFVRLADALR
jgi:16S rRNA A1518/A1519 N6-dimethyltransferase RsmA/KsgA/DIM1 with predicted DNA glycosylase/AP lyase activity